MKFAKYSTKIFKDEKIEYTTIAKYTRGFAKSIYDNLNL